jgi:hypothetical protein
MCRASPIRSRGAALRRCARPERRALLLPVGISRAGAPICRREPDADCRSALGGLGCPDASGVRLLVTAGLRTGLPADDPRFARGAGATDDVGLTVDQIVARAAPATPVIASVHHWIRWPDRTPPNTGGHLVLVTGAADDLLRLHTPSGLPDTNQRDAVVSAIDFARFFAGRGLVIGSESRSR